MREKFCESRDSCVSLRRPADKRGPGKACVFLLSHRDSLAVPLSGIEDRIKLRAILYKISSTLVSAIYLLRARNAPRLRLQSNRADVRQGSLCRRLRLSGARPPTQWSLSISVGGVPRWR